MRADLRPCFVRPARIRLAGINRDAEEDLAVLGLGVDSGGPPEYERRIQQAWGAFHEHCGRLTSSSLTGKIRRLRRVQCVAPGVAYGSWAWLWDATTHSRINGAVHKIVCCLLGATCAESEDWFSYHTHARRAAIAYVQRMSGHAYTDQLLVQAARPWEAWMVAARTHLRRMVAWNAAACSRQNSSLIRGLRL